MAFSISFKDMDGRELAGHDEAGSRYQPGATGASEAKSRWPGGLTTDSRIAYGFIRVTGAAAYSIRNQTLLAGL
jgi:hypothetical protein